MDYQIPAIISIKLDLPDLKNGNGNSVFCHWDNVNAVIDFCNSQISCELELNCIEALALLQSNDALKITSLSVDYNNFFYDANIEENDYFISHVSPVLYDCPQDMLEHKKIHVSFSMKRTVIQLTSQEEKGKNYLVFSGANRDEFQACVQYKGQSFVFQSHKNSGLLMVSSDRVIHQESWPLIILAYSLFQNGEITLLESHSQNLFQLYVQLPPPAGARLCKDKAVFLLIWKWLARNNEFMRQRNILDFFFAGTRSHGSNLDFRLINLFVCMNSICGKNHFGDNISKYLGVSKGDGLWLSYIRNYMVHEGKSILEAIDGATSDFIIKQAPKGIKMSRYMVYSTATGKWSLPFALYSDIIDLLMAYFMKTIGYDKPIRKMYDLFGLSVK